MIEKHKHYPIEEKVQTLLLRLGMSAMAIATVLGMTEITDRQDIRAVTLPAPAYAFAAVNVPDFPLAGDATFQREREEVGRVDVSYGVTMRTPSCSGKL